MLELPFNLSGRRKNANLEETFVFSLTSSIEGRLRADGIRFITLCTNPSVAMALRIVGGKFVKGVGIWSQVVKRVW